MARELQKYTLIQKMLFLKRNGLNEVFENCQFSKTVPGSKQVAIRGSVHENVWGHILPQEGTPGPH